MRVCSYTYLHSDNKFVEASFPERPLPEGWTLNFMALLVECLQFISLYDEYILFDYAPWIVPLNTKVGVRCVGLLSLSFQLLIDGLFRKFSFYVPVEIVLNS